MIQIISVTTRTGLIMVLGMKSRKKDMHQLNYGNVLILSNTPSVLRNRKGNPHSPDCYHWQLHVLTNEIRLYADRKTNAWEEANPKNITPPLSSYYDTVIFAELCYLLSFHSFTWKSSSVISKRKDICRTRGK